MQLECADKKEQAEGLFQTSSKEKSRNQKSKESQLSQKYFIRCSTCSQFIIFTDYLQHNFSCIDCFELEGQQDLFEISLAMLREDMVKDPGPKNFLSPSQINKLKRRQNKKQEVCSICSQEIPFYFPLIEIPCAHSYHQQCLSRWLVRNNCCPLCRVRVSG